MQIQVQIRSKNLTYLYMQAIRTTGISGRARQLTGARRIVVGICLMTFQKLRTWPRRYLFQAPRGWLLKLSRNSDQEIAGLISGQSVAVVGNAKSLLATTYGSAIDTHDIIIRLNKGYVTEPTAQGTRTDMVGLTPEFSEAETMSHFEPRYFLMLIPKMRHYKLFSRDAVRRTLFYNFRHWIADRNLIGRRPSSGFMAISWMVRLGLAQSITLYGFDFGATPTYYNPEGYKTPHDYDREREIVLEWERRGLIRIVYSS